MVMSWLLNSLSKDISDSMIYFKTTKELWDSLEQRFGRSNGAKLYHLILHLSWQQDKVEELLDLEIHQVEEDKQDRGFQIHLLRDLGSHLPNSNHTRPDLSFVVLYLSQ